MKHFRHKPQERVHRFGIAVPLASDSNQQLQVPGVNELSHRGSTHVPMLRPHITSLPLPHLPPLQHFFGADFTVLRMVFVSLQTKPFFPSFKMFDKLPNTKGKSCMASLRLLTSFQLCTSNFYSLLFRSGAYKLTGLDLKSVFGRRVEELVKV